MSVPSAKTRQRREAQRLALIDAAERAIASGGVQALKARDLAREIDVALGALYNLVSDLDALALHVASRTLAQLERAVIEAASRLTPEAAGDPVRRLVAFARAYHRFAARNMQRWHALFAHQDKSGRSTPQWLIDDQMRVFLHVTNALRKLLPQAHDDELFLLTRTLFGAVHGVTVLGLDDKLAAMPADALDSQLDTLVTAFCAGLIAERHPSPVGPEA